MSEPTEAYPNGLPADGFLNFNRIFGEGVLAFDADGTSTSLSASDLGMREGFDWSKAGDGKLPPKFDSYRAADMSESDRRKTQYLYLTIGFVFTLLGNVLVQLLIMYLRK